jgi:hypothetical protein
MNYEVRQNEKTTSERERKNHWFLLKNGHRPWPAVEWDGARERKVGNEIKIAYFSVLPFFSLRRVVAMKKWHHYMKNNNIYGPQQYLACLSPASPYKRKQCLGISSSLPLVVARLRSADINVHTAKVSIFIRSSLCLPLPSTT